LARRASTPRSDNRRASAPLAGVTSGEAARSGSPDASAVASAEEAAVDESGRGCNIASKNTGWLPERPLRLSSADCFFCGHRRCRPLCGHCNSGLRYDRDCTLANLMVLRLWTTTEEASLPLENRVAADAINAVSFSITLLLTKTWYSSWIVS